MTAIEARLHTLNEIIEFAKKEQKQYEGKDEWVVVDKKIHVIPIGTKVDIVEKTNDGFYIVKYEYTTQKVRQSDIENRNHIDRQYFALQTVIDECNRKIKLLNHDNKRS